MVLNMKENLKALFFGEDKGTWDTHVTKFLGICDEMGTYDEDLTEKDKINKLYDLCGIPFSRYRSTYPRTTTQHSKSSRTRNQPSLRDALIPITTINVTGIVDLVIIAPLSARNPIIQIEFREVEVVVVLEDLAEEFQDSQLDVRAGMNLVAITTEIPAPSSVSVVRVKNRMCGRSDADAQMSCGRGCAHDACVRRR